MNPTDKNPTARGLTEPLGTSFEPAVLSSWPKARLFGAARRRRARRAQAPRVAPQGGGRDAA